jgi:glycosyltransferase involved in cell wall biosynthesis
MTSIIVPVYNGEKYLDRCVKSLIVQNNVEIILVDDGSTDSSPNMCDAYSMNYNNIKVIHQKNAGDGAARNAGLEIFNGDYVMFVDADDYIPNDAINVLYKVAEQESAEIVIGTINCDTENPNETINLTADEMICFGINQMEYLRTHSLPKFAKYINPGSQCTKLIKRELFTEKNVRFHTNIRMHHQDTLFSMGLYRYCDKVTLVNKSSYYYDTEVPGSMRKKMAHNKKEEVVTLITEMGKVIDKYDILDNKKKQLTVDFAIQMIYECWSEYYIHADNNESVTKRNNDLKHFLMEYNVKENLNSMDKNIITQYPAYKQFVLKGMKHGHTMFLSVLAVYWSMLKRIRG